jgi:hypothetical protein
MIGQERKGIPMITTIEYVQLFALICGAGFCSYLTHEVGNAIQSMLHGCPEHDEEFCNVCGKRN